MILVLLFHLILKTNLKIGYDPILSFADPSANFGLILQNKDIPKKNTKNLKIINQDNIVKL